MVNIVKERVRRRGRPCRTLRASAHAQAGEFWYLPDGYFSECTDQRVSAERTRRRNASSPPSSSVNQPEHQEQQDRSNRRRYDRGNETTAKLDMKVWQKPVPYQGAHDSNCNVSDQAESSTLNQLASKPTRDQAHEQNDE